MVSYIFSRAFLIVLIVSTAFMAMFLIAEGVDMACVLYYSTEPPATVLHTDFGMVADLPNVFVSLVFGLVSLGSCVAFSWMLFQSRGTYEGY